MSTRVDDNTSVVLSSSGAGPREISNKYQVLSQLGQGGMGTVYKVRHTHLDTILALKVLQPGVLEGSDMVARFYREARVMARLKHPNIAQVLDIDRDDALNFYYFVMEYVEGQTLRQYLRDRKGLPPTEVLTIARQVASALAYAHAQTPPVIHRDIKPSNIMIEDRSNRVVVMDFGIAKELVDDSDVTRTGAIMGTMQYCAPEQMRHEPLDGATDIYALGLVMYEMYTGDRFFSGMTETAIVGKVLYDSQDNVPDFPADTPPVFTALVTKAIAKSRQIRYQRIADFLRDLEACQVALRDSATLVVSSPVKLTLDQHEATSPSPSVAAVRDERTVVRIPPAQQTSQGVHPSTQPVAAKVETVEKSLPPSPARKATAPSEVAAPAEVTMGVASPEVIDDLDQDRWAIGETASSRKVQPKRRDVAPPSAPRHRSLWPLALLGLALVGGLAFLLRPFLTPAPPPQPTIAAPVMARVEPQDPKVRVLEGETVAFTAQAEGATPLRYEWAIDGQVIAQTESWTYRPTVGDRSETSKDVRVQVTDRQGQVVERHWQVTVTYISKPPQLQAFAPKKGTIEVTSGTTQPFRVDVTDPDRGEALTYTWTINGEEAGKKATLNWNVPDPGSYKVHVDVSDPSGLTVSKDWQVKVVPAPPPPVLPEPTPGAGNAPPQITRYVPDEAVITTQEGQSLSFAAAVSDPNGDQLTYEWSVDGKRVARGSSTAQPTMTWKAKGAGNHGVRIVVSDRDGLTAMREWQVAVAPSSGVSPETASVTPPVTNNTPPQITTRTPDAAALKTSTGQTLAFEAAAIDPEGDALTYEWFVNGKKTAQGAKFSFAADEKGNRRIELRVTDARGLKESAQWEVEVGAAPTVPRVVMFTPHQKRYATYPHLSRFFGIEIDVPGEVEPALTYEWKVDGRAVRGGALFEFKDQPVGSHDVEVTAITSSGARVSHNWTVEVRRDEGERAAIYSPQLEISDLTNTVSTDKKMVIVTGKLRNIDAERAAENVIVWVTAVNGQGEEISRQMTLPTPQPIEPGRTSTFQVQLSNRDDAVDFRVQVVSK
jgi:serine/threonine protein kinase